MHQVKRIVITVAALALLLVVGLKQSGAAEESYKGVITDSQCAMNVHSLSKSHKEMLQDKTIGSTPADCVWYCVKQRGGRFVLQNKDKVYKLDDQTMGREFAGKKVEVFGTLDTQTNTIHVRRLQPLADDDKSVPTIR
jgi:hypothetical protein